MGFSLFLFIIAIAVEISTNSVDLWYLIRMIQCLFFVSGGFLSCMLEFYRRFSSLFCPQRKWNFDGWTRFVEEICTCRQLANLTNNEHVYQLFRSNFIYNLLICFCFFLHVVAEIHASNNWYSVVRKLSHVFSIDCHTTELFVDEALSTSNIALNTHVIWKLIWPEISLFCLYLYIFLFWYGSVFFVTGKKEK